MPVGVHSSNALVCRYPHEYNRQNIFLRFTVFNVVGKMELHDGRGGHENWQAT